MNKLIVDRDELHARLTKAFDFIPDKFIIGMYESFLLDINAATRTLSITAVNSNAQITLWCPCEASNDFKICVPAKIFTRTVALYRNSEVVIVHKDGTNKIDLKNGKKSEASITMDVPPKDFHPMPFGEDATTEFTIQQAMLGKAMKSTRAFINTKLEKNDTFRNVSIRQANSKVVFTSTNGGSLVRLAARPISINKWTGEILLPLEASKHISNLMGESGEVSVIANSKKICVFTSGDMYSNFQMTATLHTGKFPDTEKFFGVNLPGQWIVNTSDFDDAIKRTKLYNADSEEFPKVDIDNTADMQEATFTATDADNGRSGKETITITNLNNSLFKRKMSINLLIDAIKQCDSAEVLLTFDNDNNRTPLCIAPKVENVEEDVLRFLVMGTI
jgi:DNA polymerase III sliding clamp (beta) subunit (PCNA family)